MLSKTTIMDLSTTMHSPQEDTSSQPPQTSSEWDAFLARFNARQEPEAKLQEAIDFMRASISREDTPHFKHFWEARALCLVLFKENIQPTLRSILWDQYDTLSKEARRLKEILDEQSAFAAEQVEIAIQALESELDHLADKLAQMHPIELPTVIREIRNNQERYQQMQKELNYLNTAASRINAMRKDLIKTDMRIRQKNKFFQRLSHAGDKVFPRRKELIQEISDLFSHDVDAFIKAHFSSDKPDEALFRLREEIKALQNMAKILTLNTQSFTHTRMRLSSCWDQLKQFDKERKKERAAKKSAEKEEFEKARHAEQERIAAQEERNKRHKEAVGGLKQSFETLLHNVGSLDSDEAIKSQEDLKIKLQEVQLSKAERLEFERHLKTIRDLVNDKKQQAILALSPDSKEAFDKLNELLSQHQEDRQEVKALLEKYRRESGSSGLDFSQAIQIQSLIATEKERLDKINVSIHEIEAKLSEFRY